jgi:hypothetical protein
VNNGPCHVSGIFLPLRVNSLPLAKIYEVKIPLRKWKISLLQRNPAHMTWAIIDMSLHTMMIFFQCNDSTFLLIPRWITSTWVCRLFLWLYDFSQISHLWRIFPDGSTFMLLEFILILSATVNVLLLYIENVARCSSHN